MLSAAGVRPSSTTFAPFVFSAEPPTSDADDAEPPDEATLREIGTIRLEVTRVQLVAVVPAPQPTCTGTLSAADVAKKRALAQHHVALGAERVADTWMTRSFQVSTLGAAPHVVFEFRYRSRGASAVARRRRSG